MTAPNETILLEWLAQAMMHLDRSLDGYGDNEVARDLVAKYKSEPWADLSVFGDVQQQEESHE